MTYEEKLELIVKAIREAKKTARKGYFPKLYVNADNKLSQLSYENIRDILLQLQDDEKVI